MRLPISEALAFHSLDRGECAINVAVAEGGAVIVPEIKFRKIAVKMFFLAVLIDALHPAFEDRECALNRIGVNIAANIFASGMLHGFMRGKMLIGTEVETAFIGV